MSQPPAGADRGAKRFVVAVWVACGLLLLGYAARTATTLPLLDEYFNVPFVVDPLGVPLSAWWSPHNEHRIPLPRLLFVLAVKAAGNDFRAPRFLNAACIAASAWIVMRAIAGTRGRWLHSDAAVPLIVMSLGQYENLLWGFQIQFIASTSLALLQIAIVLRDRFADAPRCIAVIGIITLLEPLCGANGLALAPAGVLLLAAVAFHNRSRRPLCGMAVAFAMAGLALILAYLHGLPPTPHQAGRAEPAMVVDSFVNFVGLGFGSGTVLRLHGWQLTGRAGTSEVVLVLLLVTLGRLLPLLRSERTRFAAAGLGFSLIGLLCLGAALAYGRAPLGGVLTANRYTTLAIPILIALYAVWSLDASRIGRWVTACIAVAAAAAVWPNLTQARELGRFWTTRQAAVERDIRDAMPQRFLIDRHYEIGNREYMARCLQQLREHRIGPFRDLASDPPLDETAIPVRVLRHDGLAPEPGGGFRVTRSPGTLVLALPEPRFVYGLRLRYRSESPERFFLHGSIGWEPGAGVNAQLHHVPQPIDTFIFVNREIDCLRIELTQVGAMMDIHELALLSARP